jgi:hypothetical protein
VRVRERWGEKEREREREREVEMEGKRDGKLSACDVNAVL